MLKPKNTIFWGLAVLASWFCLLWQSQENLRHLEIVNELPPLLTQRSQNITSLGNTFYKNDQGKKLRFMVFQGDLPGQGAGNILNGLLAAHLLADEFDRILCISPAYADFLLAFDPVESNSVQFCPQVLKAWEAQMNATNPLKRGRKRSYKHPPDELLIQFTNFDQNLVDECELKQQLASDTPVWFLRNNMYPRWPTNDNNVQDNYFEKHYQPNKDLTQLLPRPFPSTVVHLRKEDGPGDLRNGLDESTLNALGDYLEGQSPYLVTNHVEFYPYFRGRRWSHPNWETVVHSAVLNGNYAAREYRLQQKLQMWADWYILLQAKTVYHTFSDFSASAVHWMDPTSQSSRVIRGYNSTAHKLDLDVEWWRRQVGQPWMSPLVGRSTEQMLHCSE